MPTVKFYIKNPYDDAGKLRPAELSIYAIFTKSRKERFTITLDEKIYPKHWDFKNQQVKNNYRGHLEVNSYLADVKANLLKLYRDNRDLPFLKFKELALAKPSIEKKSIFEAFDQFLQAYKSEKDSKTVAKYETLLVRLTDFDKVNPIDLPSLDYNFYDRFKNYLLSLPNPFYRNYSLHPDSHNSGDYHLVADDKGLPVGIFDDSVYSFIIQLKTFLAWAEKRNFPVHNSYKTWEIIRRVHPPVSLTSKELEQLENAVFTSPALDVARDYLVFECRTGQRISDIKRFDLKDLHNDKWTFTPKKGNRLSQKQITVHFKGYCAPALDILQKYNWKMPVISEQKLNDNIKRACKEAGINSPVEIFRWAGNKRVRIDGPKYEFVSSHTGRKSFITLALQGGLPESYVMELTGISELKTLRHYRGKFEDSAIEKELEKMPHMKRAI